MVKSWDELKIAIQNLKKAKRPKSRNIYNLPIGTLLRINGGYYLIEEKTVYEDWTEYKLKELLSNKKSYLDVEEDRYTLWKRLPLNEEINILEKYVKGICQTVESGLGKDYKYYTVKCDGRLYSIEEYETDGKVEREVYKGEEVEELKLL